MLVIAYYDFDYIEEFSRYKNLKKFLEAKEEDYMSWQVYTCQDYGVSPAFDYEQLKKHGLKGPGDVKNIISEITKWPIERIEYK